MKINNCVVTTIIGNLDVHMQNNMLQKRFIDRGL